MALVIQTGYQKGADVYDIKVYDSNSLPTATVDLSSEGFKLDYTPVSDERFSPIFTSILTINVVYPPDSDSLNQTYLSLFLAAFENDNTENETVCVVEKNSSLWWVGTIVPEIITYQDTKAPYFVQLRFSDGISKLKDIDYNNSGTAYTGNATLAEHIFNCLDEIGVTSYHSSNDFIIDNTYWVEDDMPVHTVATGDITRLLEYARLDHRLFKTQDKKGKITYNSCFEVLEKIMLAFNCRLMYSAGSFRIDQYQKLRSEDIFYYTYDNTGTIDTTPVRDTAFYKAIDTDNQRVVSSGGTISFLPGFKDVIVYYDHFSTRNLIEGEVWDESSTARTFDEFDRNAGTAAVLMGWNVQYNVDFSAGDTPNFVLWRVRIKIGSYYLRRTATVGANRLVTFGKAEWSLSNSYYYFAGDYTTFNNLSQEASDAFITPVPPVSGTLEVIFEEEAVYDLDGNIISALNYTLTFDAEGYVEALINGVIKDQSDRTSFLTINNFSTNSKRFEREVVIGDGPTGNSFGHLKIYNGTDWEVSDDWRAGDSGSYTDFGALLANEIMASALTPAKQMNAVITGDYEAHLPLNRGSNKYIGQRLTFTAKDDLWQGSWFDLKNGTTYTAQTPEQEIVRTRPLPPSVLAPTTEPPTLQVSGKDQILNRLIPAGVGSGGLSSGATVTSIPLKSAATGEDFIKNDIIVLVNFDTGEEQEFTVSSNVAATDTTISVNSVTATADFPEGSFIIQKTEQAKEQLNTSLAKRLPLEDYQVDANYTNKLTITNMDEFSIQVRDDATSPTAVTTLTMNMSSAVWVYQKGGDEISIKLDDATGIEILYNDASNGVTGITIKDGIINLENVPNYADDTAADAALSSGDIYTVTGDRTLYKKP